MNGRSMQRALSTLAIASAAVISGCTYHVDSVVDAPDANPGDFICADGRGMCTLRAAVMEANATPIAERIEIPAGTYDLTLPIASGGGSLVIAGNVMLRGAAAGSTIVNAGAVNYDGVSECPTSGASKPVFTINSGTVGISYLTAQGGFGQFGGGIVVNAGTVEITDAVIRRNVAFTGGGGVLTDGGVTRIRRTSIIENCATGAFGGGILNTSDGELWVYDTLIARNRSNRAGGVRNDGALNLRSTTISGNVADSPSAGTGGMSQNGFAVLNSVTITNNTGRFTTPNSFFGGGIQTTSNGTSVVKNSIIAGNDGQGGANDCVGELTFDSRNNLIGDSEGCEISGFVFTYLLDVDPELASLASNGGPTQTHALLAGSPAREAAYQFPPPAADACELRDQRGVPRPQGAGRCDMGAFEAGNAGVFVTSFVLVNADTDTDLFTIRNGELLNLTTLPPNLSIRAVVSGAPGSVVFAFDANAAFQTENVAPYALDGDSPAGDFLPVEFTPGQHTIRATPFAGANGGGTAGGSLDVTFMVFGG
jgi:CSLREA domain-containing protein